MLITYNKNQRRQSLIIIRNKEKHTSGKTLPWDKQNRREAAHKVLHRKWDIGQHDTIIKECVKSGDPEG